ncbi:MAG: UvrB/UvrC motif-containing protein [Anaerohalosphaeraceae bacterium]|nr:UvrB/UvrC motif-containing protein [Anaerohalosphaeraceae bacterium]
MRCEICKTAMATVHLTEIINGHRSEKHLCENCAASQGVTAQSQLSLNELLSSLLAAGDQNAANQSRASVCQSCGNTMEEFSKTSLLGCPDDYEAFGDAIEMVIRKAQNDKTQHEGKVPVGVDITQKSEAETEIAGLKKQLADAIESEDYETAAKLRDRIQKMQ